MIIQETFTVKKDNGKALRGILFRPDQQDRPCPTVIFSHGFGSNYRELMHHGPGFAENGIICVFFDFCGGGEESLSDGTMHEMTVLTEAEDLYDIMKDATGRSYVNEKELYLMGESQGGLVSAIVAGRRQEDIQGLILWYAAFEIPDDAKERLEKGITDVFGLELSADYDRDAKDIDVTKLQKAFEKPVLLIHGDEDTLVPLAYSETAALNYAHADLRIIKGGGHGFDGRDSDDARNMSIAFIKSLLTK